MTPEERTARHIMDNLRNRGLLDGLSPWAKQDLLEDILHAIKIGSETDAGSEASSPTRRSEAPE